MHALELLFLWGWVHRRPRIASDRTQAPDSGGQTIDVGAAKPSNEFETFACECYGPSHFETYTHRLQSMPGGGGAQETADGAAGSSSVEATDAAYPLGPDGQAIDQIMTVREAGNVGSTTCIQPPPKIHKPHPFSHSCPYPIEKQARLRHGAPLVPQRGVGGLLRPRAAGGAFDFAHERA